MPIYEYRCESCGEEIEKLQKISDPLLTECPACGRDTLAKLVSASSFRLKGSGWYESDFKTGKKKNGVGDNDTGAGASATKTAAPEAPASAAPAQSSDKAAGSSSGQAA